MPDNSDTPIERKPRTVRPVILHVGTMGEVPVAGAARDPIKSPSGVVAAGGKPPDRPSEWSVGAGPPPAVGTGPRPDDGGGEKRVFTSWRSSSQSRDTAQDDRGPVPVLPRTRYRFGAALGDAGSAVLPPEPALASWQGKPLAAGIAAWRQALTVSAALHRRATAVASGTKQAPTAPDGGTGVRKP